ncbi:MAG: DUF3369 domain-containing protein, partial [Myxococcota bacterium]|nr:DUF3369 domain-containing protein [Myxococcota bacterium]
LLSPAQELTESRPAEVLPEPAQETAEPEPVRPLFTPSSRLQSALGEPDQAEGIRRQQRKEGSAVSQYTLPSSPLSEPRRRGRPPWEILLLEGDRGLVRQIQSAFEQLQVMEKTAKVTYVGSAEEAQVLLSMRDNFALFIADVSLLEERGGLAFLRWLRAQSSLQSLRIVLRTEEAGSAPNPTLLRQLSVSDYWPRRELTIHRVQLQSAELIQSYHNQRYFERQRVVLQQMIGCVGLLRAEQGLSQLLSQLIDLIEPQLAGKNTVLIFFQLTKNRRLGEGILLGGTGPYQNQQPRPLNELLPRERLKTLEESFRTRQFVRHNGTMSFLKIARSGQGCALIVREIGGMSRWVERSLMTLCESTLRLISEQLLNHQRQRQISAAERFIPRELVSWFGRRSALDLELGDFQRCRGWVLCCELSGLHDLNAAPEVERLLLQACQLILPCVKKHGGIFDKAVGGQIIAHFPSQLAPLPCCRELGALLQLEGDGLQVNLGLHGGELLLCTVGHEERLEITVISEVVQLASRLCALARELSCFSLASDLVLAAAPEDSRAWLRAVGRYQGPETRGRLPLFQVLTPVESRESAPEEELSPLLELLYSGDAEVGEQLQHLAGSYPADRLLPVLIDHFVSRPAWS